jgi:hypothetical protein
MPSCSIIAARFCAAKLRSVKTENSTNNKEPYNCAFHSRAHACASDVRNTIWSVCR